MLKEILSVRKYKAGYYVHKELHDGSPYGCPDFMVDRAYTTEGLYIGDSKMARFLCVKHGIKPELIPDKEAKTICSIGFSEKYQQWFGWSHRAINAFGIGSEVIKGDCAYQPKNKKEFLTSEIKMWNSLHYHNVRGKYYTKKGKKGILIMYSYNKKNSKVFIEYPEKFGKGEWIAETLDDAKEMAIAFAKGVA